MFKLFFILKRKKFLMNGKLKTLVKLNNLQYLVLLQCLEIVIILQMNFVFLTKIQMVFITFINFFFLKFQ